MKTPPDKRSRHFVAQRVLALRKLHGWRQEDLAAHAGITRTSIGFIEGEKRGVGIDLLGRIASAFGMTIQQFFCDKK